MDEYDILISLIAICLIIWIIINLLFLRRLYLVSSQDNGKDKVGDRIRDPNRGAEDPGGRLQEDDVRGVHKGVGT